MKFFVLFIFCNFIAGPIFHSHNKIQDSLKANFLKVEYGEGFIFPHSPANLQPAIQKMPPILDQSREVVNALFLMVHHEAGNQPREGKIAVLFVSHTRLLSKRFKNAKNLEEIVYQPNPLRLGCQYEFDFLCFSKPVDLPTGQQKQEILDLVKSFLVGELENPCPEAFFYWNPKVVKNKPEWAFDDTKVCTVGDHEFHKALDWGTFVAKRKRARNNT